MSGENVLLLVVAGAVVVGVFLVMDSSIWCASFTRENFQKP